MSSLLLLVLASASAADYLATFDGAPGTTFDWLETNDPVMGGKSHATFVVGDGSAVFNGTCAIVDSLQAPGFCSAATEKKLSASFADVSSHVNGSLQLKVRSTTPSYGGFFVAFSARGVPRNGPYSSGSFKAPFVLDGAAEQIVRVPFSQFSWDWSGYTGACDTLDPTGTQHHCCTAEEPQYCPTADFLSKITDVEVWAEGTEGDFHLEIFRIGAGDD